jgi:hypothetical protein
MRALPLSPAGILVCSTGAARAVTPDLPGSLHGAGVAIDHVLPPSDWKTRTAVGVPPHVRHRSEVLVAKRLGTRVEAFPYGNRCVLPQDEKRSEDPVPGRIAPCPSLR